MTKAKKLPILPPAMLGILGGGQLGRMFTVAAKQMGYGVTVLDPDPHAPAAALADKHICAPFDDLGALADLSTCAAITTEFENVNAQAMRALASETRVCPSGDCVEITQNRIQEKAWIAKAGLKTAPYLPVTRAEELTDEAVEPLLPGVLKTAMLGYDGKGQIRVSTPEEARTAFEKLGKVPCVLEKMLNLHSEISVIVCRLNNQQVKCFPPAENRHEDGILAYSIVPARLPDEVQQRAQAMACQLADALNYIGVLAVEIFVIGADHELIVNEMAPRPHNSGHYTLDACASSQFEQQVRIMCGLPPADTRLLSCCSMANLLGDVWLPDGKVNWQPLLQRPDVHLHLYGKKDARPGRKMGHFTVLSGQSADIAFMLAHKLQRQLQRKGK
ncbi:MULTISPECIES: 5-(carboxyamino)imidazole ribonucleotide synthase [Eikenella]|uniref:N5-carboxyaminoimidazole ribonucleotide synthase n=1 Tax=Eikenella longinqua TaxID=1795827 RepID=A0A1A9S327_9NEIS|nr:MULTISPECIES: 5-(carboxyamino)imidazole ribonucleotide synthase [Eikenella]OAM31193.1 5-(carboxyamino)imidazole ribonucleotide synthase [Eikenella longinqua]